MGHKFGKAKAGDSDRRAFLQASVAVATSAAIGAASAASPCRGVHQGTARPDDRRADHRDDAAGQ